MKEPADMKERIMSTNLELISRYGLRAVTMDDLARHLGLSKKTIYQYYSEKEELVTDCVAWILDDLANEISRIAGSSNNPMVMICDIYACCLKLLLRLPNNFFYEIKKYYPAANALLADFRENVFFARIRELLKDADQKKMLRDAVNIDLICNIHFFRIQDLLDNLEGSRSNDFEVLLEHLVIFNLRGILRKEHIAALDGYVPLQQS